MKFDLRLQLVRYAAEHGLKPAARWAGCTIKIARTWWRRWRAGNGSRRSLLDRSRAPHSCPRKTPAAVEARIVCERQKAPCLGARRRKDFRQIPAGAGAIARVLRRRGLRRKRKKKYEKKRDLRESKARYRAFEALRVDTKYLTDIPFYAEQLWRHGRWPRFPYTCRDVKTGAAFLGFARERGEARACCFIAAVGAHLRRRGWSPGQTTIQSDNGSEFSGQERKTKADRGFRYVVERLLQARRRFIPPGRKNRQADVETLHEPIEAEFFDLERLADRADVFERAGAWQLWRNAARKNGHKGGRSPDETLLDEYPKRAVITWLLPALDLDALPAQRVPGKTLHQNPSGGYHVPALPENDRVIARSRQRMSV